MKKFMVLFVLLNFLISLNPENAIASSNSGVLKKLTMQKIKSQFSAFSDDEKISFVSDSYKDLSNIQFELESMSDSKFNLLKDVMVDSVSNESNPGEKIYNNLSAGEKSMFASGLDPEVSNAADNEKEAIIMGLNQAYKKDQLESLHKIKLMDKNDWINKVKVVKSELKDYISPSGSLIPGGHESSAQKTNASAEKIKLIAYLVIVSVLVIAACFLVPGIYYQAWWAVGVGAGLVGVVVLGVFLVKQLM